MMSDDRLKEIQNRLYHTTVVEMARELLEFREKHRPGKCAFLVYNGRGIPVHLEESDLDTIAEVPDGE